MGVVRRTISPHAATLRRNMTDAERTLWFELRGRRLAGYKFKRQWTIEPYVADFCCIERRLVVEVDGGQHDNIADCVRTTVLRSLGYRVIRFWNHDVLSNLDGVLGAIIGALEEQDPHPNPLPRAGEGA